MKVNVGREITVDVDTSKLNQTVLDHIIYLGLRNAIMDSHAGAAKKAEETERPVMDVAREMVEKKIAALYAGEIRVIREGSTKPKLSAVESMAIELAMAAIKAKMSGDKTFAAKVESRAKSVFETMRTDPEVEKPTIRKATNAVMAELAETLAKQPAYVEKAKAEVARRNALIGDFDDLDI